MAGWAFIDGGPSRAPYRWKSVGIDPNITVYCGILREGYEALAMYCFGRYITACLGNFCLVTLLLCYLPQLALVLELHFV